MNDPLAIDILKQPPPTNEYVQLAVFEVPPAIVPPSIIIFDCPDNIDPLPCIIVLNEPPPITDPQALNSLIILLDHPLFILDHLLLLIVFRHPPPIVE